MVRVNRNARVRLKVSRVRNKRKVKNRNVSGKLVTKPRNSSVVKVVRSILSFLPGQSVIQPLADIVFKGLGYSDKVKLTDTLKGKTFQAAVNVMGLISSTEITAKDIVAFASNSIRDENGEVYSGADFKTKIDIIRMLSMEIALRNTTPIGSKTGNWAAWLKLIKHENQDDDKHAYTYKDLSEMSNSVVATAREDIKLKVSRFIPQWKCGRELALFDTVAILYISFEDLNRTTYSDFTAKDFSCSGTISSSFIIMAEQPGNYPRVSTYKMKDLLSEYDYMIFGKGVKYQVKSSSVQEYQKKAYINGLIKGSEEEGYGMMIT